MCSLTCILISCQARSFHFFQKHWDIVGNSVSSFYLKVLNHDFKLSYVNDTLISLISKIANPRKIGDFCPISLCNVLYKIVDKCLANRMEHMLELSVLVSECVFFGSFDHG